MSAGNGLLGEIWVYVGKRKTGKTTQMMKDTSDVPGGCLFVREIHGSRWQDEGRNASPGYIPIGEFVAMCANAQDSVFVIEDASAVFSGRVSELFMECLVRSREEGVTILLAFHSFRKMPFDIFDMIDGIVIFKTRDLEYRITDRTDDETILNAWRKVKASPNPYESIVIKIED